MTLSDVCIKRPVFTTMLIMLPLVLGLIALARMGVDMFPKVDIPIVVITTTRLGTSVEEMESSVTKKIEKAVNTVSGIDELMSSTKEGISQLRIVFVLEKDPTAAQQEVQSKINQILSQLPTGTDTPIIDKVDLDAIPILTIAVSGQRPMREVTEIADKTVTDAISSIDGVGSVTMIGGNKRAMQVVVDTAKLEGYRISIDQVRAALVNQNLEIPGGRIDQTGREVTLRTMGRMRDATEFNNIIIANIGGQPLRIRDIGRAEDSIEEPRTAAILDGTPTVNLIVLKQSGENTVEVIDRVKRKLADLRLTLAAEGRTDVRLEVIRDQSRFIKDSIHEVEKHLFLGGVLVSLTILLFLRDWRTMVIASISIPISIIATFAAMNAAGFTFNNITLLALVMAVGIVIDDAVVVHENIFRWMEEKGYDAWQAAGAATREVALAVMATTFSLVVIFLPIAFMSGMVGRFFKSFGITMVFSILISLLVSFTLTPMLCSRFLKLSKKAREAAARGDHSHHSGGIYGWLAEKPYMLALRWSLRHRWAIMALSAFVMCSLVPWPVGNWIAGKVQPGMNAQQKAAAEARQAQYAWLNYPGLIGLVGTDFLPVDDQSEFDINFQMPPGYTLDRSLDALRAVETRLRALEKSHGFRIVNVLSNVGDTTGREAKGTGDVTKASMYVRIPEIYDYSGYEEAKQRGGLGFRWAQFRYTFFPPRARPYSQFAVMEATRKILEDYPDLRASVSSGNLVGGQVQYDVELILSGPNIEKLNNVSDALIAEMRQVPGLVDVDTTLPQRKPEMRLSINRARASELGVSVRDIASALQTMVGGQIVSDFKDDAVGEQYDVWLRGEYHNRNTREAIENLMIWSSKAGMIKISSVATLAETRGPGQIDHFKLQRKITLVANTATYMKTNRYLFFKWTSRAQLPVSEAVGKVMEIFQRYQERPDGDPLKITPNYALDFTGRAKRMAESNAAFLGAFVLSLVFMYMILAAQFEHFAHPIAILLAVPLTIPFAILSLVLLNQTLNLYAILGVFLLFGIVKKNGILQVDYSNQLRAKGLALREAVLEANKTRLRPILMTTVMLVAGMIPLALGQGPGAGNRASMAKVIIGGQALSLLLSLLVTPVSYTLFDDFGRFVRRMLGNPAPKPARTQSISDGPPQHSSPSADSPVTVRG